MFDKLLDFVVTSVRAEEQRKVEKLKEAEGLTRPVDARNFTIERKAGDLVQPCWKKATKHREREQEYTKKLEEAEKELCEKGVSVEAFNPMTQTFQSFQNATNVGGSGGIASGAIPNPNVTFQPRVDQRMMDNVKNAKEKMMEHRGKAEQYEKYARAFACGPEKLIRLCVEDITYYGLEA